MSNLQKAESGSRLLDGKDETDMVPATGFEQDCELAQKGKTIALHASSECLCFMMWDGETLSFARYMGAPTADENKEECFTRDGFRYYRKEVEYIVGCYIDEDLDGTRDIYDEMRKTGYESWRDIP